MQNFIFQNADESTFFLSLFQFFGQFVKPTSCFALVFSIELDVGDDLCLHMFVETTDNGFAAHHQILFEHRRANLHVERLVLDEELAGIVHDALTHHFLPGIDEAVLIEWGFEAFLTKEFPHHFAY